MWIIWSAIGLINAVEEEGSLSLRVRKFWLLSFDPQIQSQTAIGVLGLTSGGESFIAHIPKESRSESSSQTWVQKPPEYSFP